jgi:hypothetical protein
MAGTAAAGQASTEAGTTQTPEQKAAAEAAATAAAAATTDEGKAAADKAAADAKAKADADAAAGKGSDQAGGDAAAGKGKAGDAGAEPPVTYALTVPQGAEDLVSAEQLDYFKDVAKASKWSNEDAQAEVDAHVAREQARITALSNRWADETKADPEVGGEKLVVTQKNITAVLDRFLPASEPDGKILRTALNAGGYGNWRPFVRLMARIGKAMGEDSPGLGKGTGAEQSTEDVLYDHPSSKTGT